MSAEMLAYPFLFITIFFESFVLVTFLSKPARSARGRSSSATPSVAVIVPCFNEATTIARTAESVLALLYPAEKFSLILVDDGSTDGTRLAMEQFRSHPQVTIIHKENGGKHSALNAGIEATGAELVGCLDADSYVEPSALREIVASFSRPRVAATTAAMSVHKPKSILEYMQYAEYIFGITWHHTLSSINGLYVTPGPFSFYRREIIVRLGGFRYGHQAEDMEMALRLQRAGYAIENAPRALVYTKVPHTLRDLVKQRTRWTTGFLRNVLFDYRDLLGGSHGALGTLVLPLALLSVGGGVFLFGVWMYTITVQVAHALTIRSGIPLAYAYLPKALTLDWFYLPATFFSLIAFIAIVTSIGMIVIGKRISATPGSLVRGTLSYLILYSFVSPLWLMRALADIAIGKKRAWR
jgi:cellulose synthase/poly-beta-1,6-N-acetylglucosamine synthase-like glycosyltransferase